MSANDSVDRFSALQRAENSSIRYSQRVRRKCVEVSVLFSEPKIPQSVDTTVIGVLVYSFQCSSASRKFLNGIRQARLGLLPIRFQCSSASRKFLNDTHRSDSTALPRFQCSSASRKFLNRSCVGEIARSGEVSVLFSEPKIPQCGRRRQGRERIPVSVLFSEPKIPQCGRCRCLVHAPARFQCSSASRKFLNAAVLSLRSS